MENALIAFVSILILGIVVFVKIWWEGTGTSFRFTKWYFVFFILAAAGVGVYTYFAS